MNHVILLEEQFLGKVIFVYSALWLVFEKCKVYCNWVECSGVGYTD